LNTNKKELVCSLGLVLLSENKIFGYYISVFQINFSYRLQPLLLTALVSTLIFLAY